MRVVIVHNAVPEEALQSDQDTLVQVDTVRHALERLGHEAKVLPCTLNLEALRDSLQALRPDVVFNLVESLAGSDRLQYIVPGILDAMRIPYTGARTEAVFLSVDKLLAKQCLRAAGLPTPDWRTLAPKSGTPLGRGAATRAHGQTDAVGPRGTYIIKTSTEHASFGLDDDLVFAPASETDLEQRLRAASAKLGRPCFAEQFVDGREFNLSVLTSGPRDWGAEDETSRGCEVLPAAEIDFSHFPAGKPRVVGYRAKWDADSFEFHHTPRRFDFDPADDELLAQLASLARRCWAAFDLTGYVRVDFRVDDAGRPWILEVNVNPCLSPDAGFAAAVDRAGMTFEQAIARVLREARGNAVEDQAGSRPHE